MIEKSIPDVFFETAERFSKKPALLYKKDSVYFPITYKELAEKVKLFAFALQKLGVEKGDKVAILSENRPEWAISDLAILSIGAVVVPLHTTFSSAAITTVLNHSEAKILIVSNNNLLNKILLGEEELKYIEKIIFMEDLTAVQKETLESAGKIFSWKAIFSRNNNNGDSFERIYLDPDEPATLIYTSGTTGDPKGVILSHKNLLSNLKGVTAVVPVKENDIFLSFLPLSHILERLAGYYIPILSGATIAYAENIKQLPYNLKEIKPTILISVPRVFDKFHDKIWDKINASRFFKKIFKWALKQKKDRIRYLIADYFVFRKIRNNLGGRLRLTISGGASLNEKIARFFLKIGIKILEGYGLTETSPVITVNRENDFKFGTVGKPIPEVKIQISNQKEIMVKGPNVFQSYFKNEEETKKSFNEEGWFFTGDMGFLDHQGHLTIIGRKKEMIVTSTGKNIWPEHIENLLDDDRYISQSMVIGNKQKFISSLIVPDWQEIELFLKENNLPLSPPEKLVNNPKIIELFQKRIDEKINPQLSEYEKIKKFKLLPFEFSQERDELTPTLKLRRHIIEKHYFKEIESLYSGEKML